MYLSEWKIDPAAVRNPYATHKVLWSAFPGMPKEQRPFLFRTHGSVQAGQTGALMLSRIAPETGATDKLRLLRCAEVAPTFVAGAHYRFLLRANPTKMLSKERCRVPLIKHEELEGWLKGKLAEAAQVLEVQTQGRRIMHFRKGSMHGKIVSVDFTGLLRVRDGEQLWSLVCAGIGPAKAFGCGLMTLARA